MWVYCVVFLILLWLVFVLYLRGGRGVLILVSGHQQMLESAPAGGYKINTVQPVVCPSSAKYQQHRYSNPTQSNPIQNQIQSSWVLKITVVLVLCPLGSSDLLVYKVSLPVLCYFGEGGWGVGGWSPKMPQTAPIRWADLISFCIACHPSVNPWYFTS